MTGLIDGILILSLVTGIIGLIYLIILIFKLSREKFMEEERKTNDSNLSIMRKDISTSVVCRNTCGQTSMVQKQEKESVYMGDDSAKTELFSAGTVGHFPYAKLKFKVLAGKDSQREEFLIQEITSIGRSNKDDIYIEDKLVSRQHAAFFSKENKIYLMDYDSTNGTLINGTKVNARSEILIPSGSSVQLGDTTLVVEYLENFCSN